MWYLRRIVQCETIIHCASFHCDCIQVRLNTRAGWNCLLEDGAGALIHSGAGWWIIVTHCWNIIQPLENRGRTAWWRYWNNCVAIRCLGREPFTRSLTLFLSIFVINNNFWHSNFNFCKLHASTTFDTLLYRPCITSIVAYLIWNYDSGMGRRMEKITHPTKYCLGDKNKEYVMSGTYSMHGVMHTQF
jgi:hypothetical protein